MIEGRDPILWLLGSAAPDTGCDGCGDVLDVFVEWELAGVTSADRLPAAAAHLGACPDCREDHDALVALLTALGGVGGA